MADQKDDIKKADRKLGDEWLDWDGSTTAESSEADSRVFLGLAVISTVVIILSAALFLWLIYPRLLSLGGPISKAVYIIFFAFAVILFIWLLLFVFSAVTRRPITRLIVIPRLVNKLLSIVLAIGKIMGISQDRLTNSFMKVHNIFLGTKPIKTEGRRLLVLLPRCLTKEANKGMRQMRDRYSFEMATVGGGSEARIKIRQKRPQMIIAIACERDLLSGFKDVNTHIPVIGFPNRRPEGPCKNTCIDLNEIENTVKKCLL
jgi:hypothetical protein